ncbi:hypothetical protein SY83_01990 [Paenibacillus swuensis]|uniref:PI-PLC Y-box domain-containing protein n=2 Tax=Paenibacillus swuensis TaxID=1178515 RepID=A0A172TP20_9BACL|nr:hypothetical protein SY83_01990 [Paenibacillus swuensis]
MRLFNNTTESETKSAYGTSTPASNAAKDTVKPAPESASPTNADRLVMVFPAAVVPPDLEEVEEQINRYLEPKIGAVLDIKPIDLGIWWDRTGLMYASGEQLDLVFTAGWMRFGDEVSKGRYLPLEELLQQYGQGIRQVLDPSIVEAGKVDGRIYGIVTNKEFASSKGMVLRKDLVDKYNVDITKITKLEHLGPVFHEISQHEPGIVPLQAKADRSPFTYMMQYGTFDMLGEGPGVLQRSESSMRVVNMVETAEYRKYAELMYAWKRAGYFNEDAATTKDNEFEAVKAGQAFAYAESLKPGFEFQASRDTGMPMVTIPLTKPYTTTADTTSAMFAIAKKSEHPEKAMQFLNLLYSDKYILNLLNWGIEGQHYVKKNGNMISYPEGVDSRTVGYNLNQSWMFGNQLNSYLWDNEDPNLWTEYRRFNDEAERSKALGFVFNPDKVKTEIATCNLVDKEFTPAVYTGAQDPSIILPMYMEKLKAAGADKVIAEKQRQLDEWIVQRKEAL